MPANQKPKTRFPVLVTALLDHPRLAIGLGLAAVLQVSLTALGLPGWPCLFRTLTGWPCPGCGLSRALAEMATGDWAAAIHTHALSPAVALGLLVISATGFLGVNRRRRVAAFIGRLEAGTGFGLWGLLAAWLYWLARLIDGTGV
jgi:hypothetical protein